ncbi:MAG: hypothetical protein EWV80_14675 [Microcystis aeruginosa Ma_QC_B_20070730_S2]|uniref:Uncharacterized protein n=1 Tax=Microcystis aeruginosa Ma_QC_B_20070730_S2 TaxID=2486256 RepID=A0A552DJ29_MICAE|nr:MAG: hypothetical protein EWV80_14675 [Microcystis aeruginosa Ma_QC_B_20070730_S2]
MGIISQPENRSVEELDQPDGTLSKRKSLTSRRLSPCPKGTLSKRKSLTCPLIAENPCYP